MAGSAAILSCQPWWISPVVTGMQKAGHWPLSNCLEFLLTSLETGKSKAFKHKVIGTRKGNRGLCAKQILASQSASGQVLISQEASGQILTGQSASGQVLIGQSASGQVLISQSASEQILIGQNASGQVLIGQGASGQVLIGQRVRRIYWRTECGNIKAASGNTICLI
jgi:hypothetical protein